MIRRDFVTTSAAVAGAASITGAVAVAQSEGSASGMGNHPKFKMKYAPHFGMFKVSAGNDPIDQLKFAADQGFTAWEDNGMPKKDVALQTAIGKEMERLGMTMGVFVACSANMGDGKKETVDSCVAKMKDALEIAKRVNAKWCTVVPGGIDPKWPLGYQNAKAIDCLRACADVCEPSGLTMVLEPLNPWTNHPGRLLTTVEQGYLICRGVDSPSCKILDDLYHQQITEGHLIPNMERAWDEIGYIQVGDNPGRKEPTTGEINYQNIFKWLNEKGYEGVIGMEHGNSQKGAEGEQAVIDAYRYCDSF